MKNFRLSLYAFHLRQTLDNPPDSCDREADRLWESLTQLEQFLNFPELKTLKSKLISYTPKDNTYQYTPQNEETLTHEWLTHNGDALEFTPIPSQAGFKLGGNLQPFRLHDTYCVDLTLYPKGEDSELLVEQLQAFQPHILVKNIKSNLGKFFWLTGYSNHWKLRETADRWVNAFCTNTSLSPQFIEKGRLFQADCFLYEAKEITLLISFARANKADKVEQSATDNYDWFRDLLWSRQKIIFADREARECHQKSRIIYSQLESKIQDFQRILTEDRDRRISELDSLLKEIPQNLLTYNCYLRDLKAHYATLEANAQNFNTCLTHVIQSGDRLQTWSNFAEKTCPRYLTQIKTYINYLEPGKDLFSDLTNTIRATAEIEQAKSDRDRQKSEQNLQDHIQAIGVGVATSAIIASSSGLLFTEPLSWPWQAKHGDRLHPFTIAVLLSVACTLVFWGLAKWGLTWIFRSHSRIRK